jgi:hypothetical protein
MGVYGIFGVHPSALRVASGTALVDVAPYLNAFTMDPNVEELEFEYDGTSDSVPVGTKLTGTIGMGKFNTDLLTLLAGAVAITAASAISGLGVDSLWHPELGTYPFVQAEIDIRVQDHDTGAEEELRIFIWKMKLQNPWVPGDIGNLEANTQTLNWSSTLTTGTILGAALPGAASANAIHYSIGHV